MRILALILAILFSIATFDTQAQLYFDPERNGEGISVTQEGDTFTTIVFTYGALTCDGIIEPVVSPSLPQDDCDLGAQRWFIGTNDINEDGTAIIGELLVTSSPTYPDAISGNLSVSEVVGEYTMLRSGEGWFFFVDRATGSPLTVEDPLYEGFFDFTTRLFGQPPN